jgi:hypothetical protein
MTSPDRNRPSLGRSTTLTTAVPAGVRPEGAAENIAMVSKNAAP